MTHKDRILSIIFTILVTVFALIPIYEFKKHKNIKPQELYRVYLNGKSVGLIKSKSKLNDYINEEQKELKEKYNVDTVYVPKSLYISKYNGYDDKTMSEEELYKLIKDKEDFTIKGYKVIIETESGENIELNVLNKEEFKNSINTVVRAFVDNDELEAFLSGEEVVLKGVGKKIEDVYIKENIKIKEAFIPSSELILPDEKEITKYLLFGDEITEKYYTVKAGDTIESIAEDNKLAVEELLVVNQN